MKRFNIGVDTTAMRGLALQCYLAQGYNAVDFLQPKLSYGRNSPRPIG